MEDKKKIKAADARMDANAWLEHVGWATHLEGFDPEAMLRLTDPASRAPSSAPSPAFRLLDSPDLGSSETKGGAADDASFSVNYVGYEGIDWNRLWGYSIRKHRRRPRTGWVWEHGFDIEKDGSGHRFWLCKMCHQKKATITHMYDAASTSQANGRMEDIHRINKDGSMPPQRKKQCTLLDMVDLDPHRHQGPSLDERIYSIIRTCPFSTFTHTLGGMRYRINSSFDAWSSRRFTSLLGLTVHFLDDNGKFRTFLLGLPRIEGRHGGENLADCISEILHEYEVEERTGYFVTDNAAATTRVLKIWRIEKLHKLQSIENTTFSLEDKTIYDVITDNATRWNSSEAMMERGYMLRNALDSLVQAEVTEWNQYVARRTQNGIKPMPKKSRKKPGIVNDKMTAKY
ncbi:hypothetical protein FANTH_14297 [Fusarium anthophilum]|uniref:BED-type domain-containing protein n=1 Tax=Fusarium anthophilum TaxID=48485 RepID=A0A8H4YJ39_9HYPO|nr:hypothetical protein FANTH_14297 [Fusarium anthophilum]